VGTKSLTITNWGKSTSIAALPDTLVIDLEHGYDYLSAYVVNANSVQDLFNIAKALREEEHHYKFVVIDTVTALEDMSITLACQRAKESNPNFSGNPSELFNLPYGAGYVAQRNAVKEIVGWFEKVVPNLILVGHVKEKAINEAQTDLNVKSLDLGGKLSNILSAGSDAICYVYRDPETGNLMANFGDMNSVLTGARVPHLAGKTILLAERVVKDNGDYDIITHWDNIYPSLKQ
jgi:hypothetical protein